MKENIKFRKINLKKSENKSLRICYFRVFSVFSG